MARDPGLEALLTDDLDGIPALTTRAMFGGLIWLHDGHLLCGARRDGMLVRLGAGRDDWALALPGIAPMHSGSRRMAGWIWAGHEAYADDGLRRRLIEAALAFVRALPAKVVPLPAVPWDFPNGPSAPVPRRPRARRPKA